MKKNSPAQKSRIYASFLIILSLHFSFSEKSFAQLSGFFSLLSDDSSLQWRDHDNFSVILQQLASGMEKRSPAFAQQSAPRCETPECFANLTDSAQDKEKFQEHLQKVADLLYAPIKKSKAQNAKTDIVAGTIAAALSSPKEEEKDRARFQNILRHFRLALSTQYYQKNAEVKNWPADTGAPELIAYAQNLTMALFNDSHITHYANDLVEKMAKKGNKNLVALPQFAEAQPYFMRLKTLEQSLDALEERFHGIQKAPSKFKNSSLQKTIKSLQGGLTIYDFDPSLEGSLYSVKFHIEREGEEPLRCLRMPTPTIGSDGNTCINPEFQAYLQVLKNQGQHHVYINLQDGRAPHGVKVFGIANELPRVQCLQNYSELPEMQDTFHVITLNKNSDFYWQKGPYQGHAFVEAKKFLKDIDHELFEKPNTGFYFPAEWREENSEQRKKIGEIAANIHRLLFSEKEKLAISERQNFLEYLYLFIAQNVAQKSFSCNKTCKDGIDRAGGANAFEHFFLTTLMSTTSLEKLNKQEVSALNQHMQSLGGMIFADALMSQQREIMPERWERFQQVSRDLVDKLKKNPLLAQELRQLTPFQKVQINLQSEQKVSDPQLQ